jgi:hypothetical protein
MPKRHIPRVGKKSQQAANDLSISFARLNKTDRLQPFSRFGTAYAEQGSSVDEPPVWIDKELEMTTFSNFARHALAAIAAVALSASLMIGSFSADPQIHALTGLIA